MGTRLWRASASQKLTAERWSGICDPGRGCRGCRAALRPTCAFASAALIMVRKNSWLDCSWAGRRCRWHASAAGPYRRMVPRGSLLFSTGPSQVGSATASRECAASASACSLFRCLTAAKSSAAGDTAITHQRQPTQPIASSPSTSPSVPSCVPLSADRMSEATAHSSPSSNVLRSFSKASASAGAPATCSISCTAPSLGTLRLSRSAATSEMV
mmetsp:Transcript_18108/g.54503  ORF Transcript_18108/g.54503 Transcript_18108/m.54503 type:complete len:214 (+) Transcript_18108:181-822(+)